MDSNGLRLTAERPYVISWNLTYRCNLACEHCYLDAGPKKAQKLQTVGFSDRSELTTEECFRVIDELAANAPEAVTILTGGEPLLRRDILEIIRYAASQKLWVVVGTNGVLVTETLAEQLKSAGVKGFALSLDALEADRHDTFRAVKGAWDNTVSGAKILQAAQFPFIVQTTVGSHNIREIGAIADFAHDSLGAKVWNLYFLVQTGRGQFVSDISQADYDAVLAALAVVQSKYRNRMMVNAKCAPHYARTLFESDPDSPFLKTYSRDAGGCPAGTHYLGIRPNGDMTPCPYLPVFGGNLRTQSFAEIWQNSELFTAIRKRSELGGRCGQCEFSGVCGGCRARAFGVTGSYLDEDPLCSYVPGKFEREVVASKFQIIYGDVAASQPESGEALAGGAAVTWDPTAQVRLEKIPLFVRGMVTKAVESYCAKHGIHHVTIEELERIKAQMPMQRVFASERQ